MGSGKIVLHICCAGCAIYTIRALENTFDRVIGCFFNPNIHPYNEFRNRRDALKTYVQNNDKDVIYPAHEPYLFYRSIRSNVTQPERCVHCWRLRLTEAARIAKEKNADAFTTTLLISPYQDHMRITSLGEEIARDLGVPFYYEDFRVGFKESQAQLKEHKLYSQNYCGCLYSLQERTAKKVYR
jgi:predicted adenine nucleotide alpha hydrolase (AANH) superfamily ATPase